MQLYKGHSQDLLFNTDWMGLSLTLDDDLSKTDIAGHVWRRYENGTNVWQSRNVLYTDRGDKVCTLLSRPKSKLINPNAALLEIENEWLYHGLGVEGIVEMLQDACPFYINGMSRCDLCIDFVPTTDQWKTINGLACGDVYVSGKRNGSGFWSVNSDDYLREELKGKRIPHCISWGHKTSGVRWKLYYKTKELKDAVGGRGWDKPYIVDQWRCAGFDELNVWRLEVAMHNCNTLEHEGGKITYPLWKTDASSILTSMYMSRFLCRKNQGHKDKSNDDEVRFLPIDTIKRVRCRKYEGMTQHNGRITLLRHLVQSLDDEQVLLDDESREDVLWHIGEIIRRDGLQNYFRSMVSQPYEEYIEDVRCRAASTEGYSGRYDLVDKIVTDVKPNTNFDVQM